MILPVNRYTRVRVGAFLLIVNSECNLTGLIMQQHQQEQNLDTPELPEHREQLLLNAVKDFAKFQDKIKASLDEKTLREIDEAFEQNPTGVLALRCDGDNSVSVHPGKIFWGYFPEGYFFTPYGSPLDYALALESENGVSDLLHKQLEMREFMAGSDGVVCTLTLTPAISYVEWLYKNSENKDFRGRVERAYIEAFKDDLAKPKISISQMTQDLLNAKRQEIESEPRLQRTLNLWIKSTQELPDHPFYKDPNNFWPIVEALNDKRINRKQAAQFVSEFSKAKWKIDQITESTKELFSDLEFQKEAKFIRESSAKWKWSEQYLKLHYLLLSFEKLSGVSNEFKSAVFKLLDPIRSNLDLIPDEEISSWHLRSNLRGEFHEALIKTQPLEALTQFWSEGIRTAKNYIELSYMLRGLVASGSSAHAREDLIIEGLRLVEEREKKPIDGDVRFLRLYLVATSVLDCEVSCDEPASRTIQIVREFGEVRDNKQKVEIEELSVQGRRKRTLVFDTTAKTFTQKRYSRLAQAIRYRSDD